MLGLRAHSKEDVQRRDFTIMDWLMRTTGEVLDFSRSRDLRAGMSGIGEPASLSLDKLRFAAVPFALAFGFAMNLPRSSATPACARQR